MGEYTTDPVESSCSYDDDDHVIAWEMGDPVRLKITPAELKIKVTGHTDVVTYGGSEHSVEGYDSSCSSPLYDEFKVVFTGSAVAKGTEVGTYPMGLDASQFSYDDPSVKASFAVTDGWLKINDAPGPGPGPGPVPIDCTITYDLNGGVYDGKTDNITEVYPKGTAISIHEAPTRDGYTFQYWRGSKYMPGDKYTVVENHIFVAAWEPNPKSGPTPDPQPTPTPTSTPQPTPDNPLP